MSTCFAVLLMMGTIASAQGLPTVPLCLDASSFPVIAAQAKATASSLYSEIGVRLEWRGTNCPEDGIQVSFTNGRPADFRPGALGYARPYEGTHIEIMMDRVESGTSPALVPVLLGYVIAHEIGHLLEGVPRHSERGIMKAEFGRQERFEIRLRQLKFSAEDIQMIHDGARDRSARLISSR